MKLSFIIPAYNEEKHLAGCLESILQDIQGIPDVEIVVVDNASTDSTSSVARSYPVTLIYEGRKGLPYARQAGLDNSTGTLVANIDADSRLPLGWTQKALKAFEGDEDLVCLSGRYIFYIVFLARLEHIR